MTIPSAPVDAVDETPRRPAVATADQDAPTLHRGSHRGLLSTFPNPADLANRPPDAIIVPTGRAATFLDAAIAVGRALSCPVIALCSRDARAEQAVRRATGLPGFIAADAVEPLLPGFETTTVLAGTKFHWDSDTALKRNVGLAVAAMAGWRHVVFLDDDMEIGRPSDLSAAASLLDAFAAAGLNNLGYPDNSAVCHAFRHVGGAQYSFIGSGALAVAVDRSVPFFPSVYNEDWLFLTDDKGLRSVAVTGTAYQKEFDPFLDRDVAGSQEFGDALAEGIFALFDAGGALADADEKYWEQFLADRYRLLIWILARIPEAGLRPEAKRSMTQSMLSALDRLNFIGPDNYIAYLQAWRRDRERWAEFLAGLPALGPVAALARLGLTAVTR